MAIGLDLKTVYPIGNDDVDFTQPHYLEIKLTSGQRSGARVALELVDENGHALHRSVMAVDWEGLNTVQFPLSALNSNRIESAVDFSGRNRVPQIELKADHDSEFAGRLYGIRFLLEREGFRETDIGLESVQWKGGYPLWPVNDSDEILELGWRGEFSAPFEWKFLDDQSTMPRESVSVSTLPWVTFHWSVEGEAKTLSLRRELDIYITPYSEILAKVNWGTDSLFTMTAIVDGGKRLDLVSRHESVGSFKTIGTDLRGAQRLEAIEVQIDEISDEIELSRSSSLALFHILLRKPSAWDEVDIEKREVRVIDIRTEAREPESVWALVPQFPEGHIGEVDPIVSLPEIEPELPFGFIFSESELSQLRAQSGTGLGKRVFEGLKDRIDTAIEKDYVFEDRGAHHHFRLGMNPGGRTPEEAAMTWMTTGGVGLPIGAMGNRVDVYLTPAALLFLLTEEEKYGIAAKTWFLRAIRSPDWIGGAWGVPYRPVIGSRGFYNESFTAWYPKGWGGYMDYPLYLSHTANAIVLTFDWIYHLLTEEERAEALQAFADHGIYILYDKLTNARDFYLGMNQGAMFAPPLMMQAFVLKDKDPLYQEIFDWTHQFMEDYGQGPWLMDGVLTEGPYYGMVTLRYWTNALIPYANMLGKSVRDVAGQELDSSFDYLLNTGLPVSADAAVRYIPWSNRTMREIPANVLSFFHKYYGRDEARFLLEQKSRMDVDPILFTNLIDSAVADRLELDPVFVIEEQPSLFYRNGTEPGDTLFAATGLRYMGGHGHKDRGSFVLFHNEEFLLLDPGNHNYNTPRSAYQVETFVHNALTFDQASQDWGNDPYDVKVVDSATSSGDSLPAHNDGIDWAVFDLADVYPEAKYYQRHFIWLRPDVFVVIDEFQTYEKQPFELNFHFPAPVKRDNDGRVWSRTEKNQVSLFTVSDQRLSGSTSDWRLGYGDERRTHRFIWSSNANTDRALALTAIVVESIEGNERKLTFEQERQDGGIGFKLRIGEDDYSFWAGIDDTVEQTSMIQSIRMSKSSAGELRSKGTLRIPESYEPALNLRSTGDLIHLYR